MAGSHPPEAQFQLSSKHAVFRGAQPVTTAPIVTRRHAYLRYPHVGPCYASPRRV